MTRIPIARRQESGFALLVIFLIAAAVAFTMYQELPRAAFENPDGSRVLLACNPTDKPLAIALETGAQACIDPKSFVAIRWWQ